MKKRLLFSIFVLGYFLTVPNTYANTGGNSFIVDAWLYNETSCANGTESTCEKTNCYLPGTICTPGTIIEYGVSDTETKKFKVIKDDGTNMTVISSEVVATSRYNNDSNGTSAGGPTDANQALSTATSSWNNLVESSYTQSKTYLVHDNQNYYWQYNRYEKLSYETPFTVRLLTVAEAVNVGCTAFVCPGWLPATWLSDETFIEGSTEYTRPLFVSSGTKLSGSQPSNYPMIPIRAVISIPKNVTVSNNDNSSSDEKNATSSTSGKSNANSQTVKVGDTLKTAVVGYIVGFIVLVLGSIVLYKSLKKNNNINIVK